MTKRQWVYVAGPMSTNPYGGVTNAVRAAERLRLAGYVPIVPQLTTLWAMVGSEATYEEWMKLDLEYIQRCDILLRLPGKSAGADREVTYAESIGKRVVSDIEELTRVVMPWTPVASAASRVELSAVIHRFVRDRYPEASDEAVRQTARLEALRAAEAFTK